MPEVPRVSSTRPIAPSGQAPLRPVAPAPAPGPVGPQDTVTLSEGARPAPSSQATRPPAQPTRPAPAAPAQPARPAPAGPQRAFNGQPLEEFLEAQRRRQSAPPRTGILQRVQQAGRSLVALARTPVGQVARPTVAGAVVTAGVGGWMTGRAIGEWKPDGRHSVDEGVEDLVHDTLFDEGKPLHGW